MNEKRLLLLIDCQYDFINGSLAVDGAQQAMDSLAGYIAAHGNEYAAIAATLDWHPACHSSFKCNSAEGLWPAHCVQHTIGAALYQPIVQSAPGEIIFFTKGNIANREEYSIFANETDGTRLAKMIADEGYTQIDVCGLCGDYCVKETVSGLINLGHADKVRILLPYTPSIDGGNALNEFVGTHHIAVSK